MNIPPKRQALQSERSFDSSTGRPTKYFKLDRTYSDVVEDELYDPQPAKEERTSPSSFRSPEQKTERIQNAFPQLFQQMSADPSAPPDAQFSRDSQYWPTMESGIRFDRSQRPEIEATPPVIADRKVKIEQQPEQSTVSPKEAFLDYPNNTDLDKKGSVFDEAEAKRTEISATAPRRDVVTSPNGRDRSAQNPANSSCQQGDMLAPKMITPVRAHEKLSPRPVFSDPPRDKKAPPISNASGPTASQAHTNATANERIRALYKEESTTSNVSAGSGDAHTPSSTGESESEPASSSQALLHDYSAPSFTCDECNESFERESLLQIHSRVHARPPTARPESRQSANENEYSDESEDEYEAGTNRTKLKAGGGPHRCDWIVPNTGRVCGTIFSRPYDLVRHQDTIHRAKKLEFRCEICIAAGSNKVFSRNDALVRHTRHVHKKDLAKRN